MQTIDENGLVEETPSRRKRIRLKSAVDVHREMAWCYRQHDAGKLPEGDLSKRIYALDTMIKAIQVADHEKELRELQAKLESLGVPGGAVSELPLTRLLPSMKRMPAKTVEGETIGAALQG